MLLLLFQEKNPNGLMRKDQMNEFTVNFERLILGKFCKGFRACACFCSVAVITCALRAQGPQFDPGQKHPFGVLFTEN